MPFWEDIEKATTNVLSEIKSHGGLDGVITNALGNPFYATVANSGSAGFHAVEAVTHSQWSMHYTALETQTHARAAAEWGQAATSFDNAWDAMVHGKGGTSWSDRLSNAGGSLVDAFTDAGRSVLTTFDARELGGKAHEHAHYAGEHANLSNANLGGVASIVANTMNVPNLTSPGLVNQMAGMNIGDALKQMLNTVNADMTTKVSLSGWQ